MIFKSLSDKNGFNKAIEWKDWLCYNMGQFAYFRKISSSVAYDLQVISFNIFIWIIENNCTFVCEQLGV